MKKWLIVFASIVILISCTGKSSSKKFEVSGTISNNSAKMIYLEELPIATMQRMEVDSALLGKDGKYSLKTDVSEAAIYNLRLDQNVYPVASVVNDVSKIELNATISKVNSQFIESYDVKGSTASKEMKDFMYSFNDKLQAIFYNAHRADSLQHAGASDSVINLMQTERKKMAC